MTKEDGEERPLRLGAGMAMAGALDGTWGFLKKKKGTGRKQKKDRGKSKKTYQGNKLRVWYSDEEGVVDSVRLNPVRQLLRPRWRTVLAGLS